ncbi:hypothetical protein RS130_23000 [Paraglaciecola aquimarina]|uniref:Glycosyltransferase 2-like domain-containing protein n=1 Tax=Paraglaciecola aquimarina TaxID=1235557 RepID=A0ABU3T285_9ALTE|nr:hypothetical protein [Paraglaciecola aquimarina]MDU0356376.1 hypothetical protein [Paraglaciecola aquimarina]
MQFEKNKEVVIVSQVYHAAVDMTLLALKSFLQQFGQGFVELLDDGSLTAEDYALLKKHIPHLNITHIKDIDVGLCPAGACWERLVHILHLSQDAYVIQVDTDTLTIGPVAEVFDHVSRNQAFTIGSPAWPEPVNTEYLRLVMNAHNGKHVQVSAERHLHSASSIDISQYCRGCAAFTGFPKGTLSFELLQAFSVEMEQKLGKQKWHEWGSEQFASNVMISVCEDPKILRWPQYQNYGFPKLNANQTVLDFDSKVSVLHFIGSNRFIDNTYSELAKRFVNTLN